MLFRRGITPLYCLYDCLYHFLSLGEQPDQTDCIFVFAGKPERKAYGVKLWRQGYAGELILSVGRFEWRGFYNLGLPGDGGLMQLVERTPPRLRHFFVSLQGKEVTCSSIQIGRFGTKSEALELAKRIKEKGYQSVMIVSSPMHLRRAAWSVSQAIRYSPVCLSLVAVPEEMSSLTGHDWWESPERRSAVREEFFKYLFYRLNFR